MLVEEFLERRPRDIPHLYGSPTCPDLERGFAEAFSQQRPDMLRPVRTRLMGIRRWDKETRVDEIVIGLIKNPAGRYRALGNRNAIVQVGAILYAAEITDKGLAVTRPIRAPYQNLFAEVVADQLIDVDPDRISLL